MNGVELLEEEKPNELDFGNFEINEFKNDMKTLNDKMRPKRIVFKNVEVSIALYR